MNPTILLALIADLYEQNLTAQNVIQQLQAKIAEIEASAEVRAADPDSVDRTGRAGGAAA